MAKRQAYKRRPGARFPGNVQQIGARIKQIERRGGNVPQGIVDDARDPASPCHAAFDWDDSSAANTQRLEQARLLIRSINVVLVDKGGREVETRAFEFVTVGDTGTYASIVAILSDQDLYDDLLTRAQKELQAFVDRYQRLGEMRGVIAAAIKVLPKRRQKARPRLRKAG